MKKIIILLLIIICFSSFVSAEMNVLIEDGYYSNDSAMNGVHVVNGNVLTTGGWTDPFSFHETPKYSNAVVYNGNVSMKVSANAEADYSISYTNFHGYYNISSYVVSGTHYFGVFLLVDGTERLRLKSQSSAYYSCDYQDSTGYHDAEVNFASVTTGTWVDWQFDLSGDDPLLFKDGVQVCNFSASDSTWNNVAGFVLQEASVSGTDYFDKLILYNISGSSNTAPTTPTITSPTNNSISSTISIDFSSSDSDGDNVNYSIYINDTLNISLTSTNISVWNGSGGYYNLKVSATDGTDWSGNASLNFIKDDAPTIPTSVNLNNTNPFTNEEMLCSASGSTDANSDSISYYYKFNKTGTILQDFSSNNTFNCGLSGCDKGDTIYCSAYAVTQWQNSSIYYGQSALVNNSLPTITITSPSDNYINNINLTASFTPNDIDNEVVSCSLIVNSSISTVSNSSVSLSVLTSLTTIDMFNNLNYNWYISCNDSTGTAVTSTPRNYILDREAPVGVIVAPTSNQYINTQTFTTSVTATDNIAIYFHNWTLYNSSNAVVDSGFNDSINLASYAMSVVLDWTGYPDGLYTLMHRFWDGHSDPIKNNTLKKDEKDLKKLVLKDTKNNANMIMKPFFKDDKKTKISKVTNLVINSSINKKGAYKTDITFVVEKANTIPTFQMNSTKKITYIKDSEYAGHLIWMPYVTDWDKARTIYVNGQPVKATIEVEQITDYVVEVSVIPSIKLKNKDLVYIDPETLALNFDEKNTTIYKDTTSPTIDQTAVSPASPFTYLKNQAYAFMANYSDNLLVNSIILQYEGTNYSTTFNGASYQYSTSDLGVGTYNYKWFADDSAGNWGNGSSLTYQITQATPSVSLTFDQTTPITYGTALTSTCSNTGENSSVLTINGSTITSGQSYGFGAGNYLINCSYPNSQNYTASYNSSGFTIGKTNFSVANAYLTTNYSWGPNYGVAVNVSYINSLQGASDVILKIYRNNTDIGNGSVEQLAVGSYQYILNSTGGQNYSSNNSIDIQTLTITKATSSISFTINGSSNGTYYTNTSTNINITAFMTTPTTGTIALYFNNTLLQNGTNYISNISIIGTENTTAWVYYYGNANYSVLNQSINISISPPPTSPSSSGTSSSTTSGSLPIVGSVETTITYCQQKNTFIDRLKDDCSYDDVICDDAELPYTGSHDCDITLESLQCKGDRCIFNEIWFAKLLILISVLLILNTKGGKSENKNMILFVISLLLLNFSKLGITNALKPSSNVSSILNATISSSLVSKIGDIGGKIIPNNPTIGILILGVLIYLLFKSINKPDTPMRGRK